MNRLDGKVAIITGGTSGMGEASAKRFAEAGAYVVVVGRNRERGEKVAEDIRKNKGVSVFFQADVADEKEVKALIAQVDKKYHKIDILFNNAGIFPVTASL